MKNGITKLTFLVLCLSFTFSATAQSASSTDSNLLLWALVVAAAVLLLFIVTAVSDNLIGVEAKQLGLDKDGNDYSILGGGEGDDSMVSSRKKVHVLKKGHDIILEGTAAKEISTAQASTFSISPKNFNGLSPIPKVTVVVGDEVKAGDVIFFDKKKPDMKFVAPVSGEVMAVNRGEKRSIADIVILADKTEMKYKSFPSFDLANSSRADLVSYMLENGVWPLMNQRPYDVTPDPAVTPANIFISTFDTAPLAPDLNFIVEGREAAFQKGLDVLGKLTSGKVHLGINSKGSAPAFENAKGVQKNYFSGPHPAGNVGVQIHHTAPINPNAPVWTVGVQEVCTIGTLFAEGKYDATRLVAVTGAELKEPKYYKTYQGANLSTFLKDNLTNDHIRIVSGDVLSGKQKTEDGHLNFFDDQVTVLEEGDKYEMFGWLLPLTGRPSISKTFPNFLFKDLAFKANTNTHGEKRAFVVSGQYESVLPMDVYPQHLMKAIMVNDFERMEGLGLYELSEEDIALCEFVCTSKMPLQEILREGLETMREQG